MSVLRHLLRLRYAFSLSRVKAIYLVIILALFVILWSPERKYFDTEWTALVEKALRRHRAVTAPSAVSATSSANRSTNKTRRFARVCRIPRLSPNGSNSYAIDSGDLSPDMIPACALENLTRDVIMFELDKTKLQLIRLQLSDSFWNESNCFLSSFERDPSKPDFEFRSPRPYQKITSDVTKIPADVENFYVWCTERHQLSSQQTLKYEDYFSVIQPRPELEVKLRQRRKPREDFYSVAIFGMDSVSHMSFRRFMPRSHEFLVNQLGAYEFNGFQSLGPGTLWSVFPLLAGKDLYEFRARCLKEESAHIGDDCVFIWNELEAAGYRTSYAEDDLTGSSIFNERPKKGFARQPVHYDFRQVALKLALHPLRMHDTVWDDKQCYGPRLTFQVLLDRMVDVARAFRARPFYHFSWSVALTHNFNALGSVGDGHLYGALQRMRDDGSLERTILVLLSDHGMRYGTLRQTTTQGLLEERLPMLYIVLPKSFKRRYPRAAHNMRTNQRKLISAYDIHATIRQLLDLRQLSTDNILKRAGANRSALSARAVSLFHPVSSGRDCKVLGLNFVYCVCEKRTSVGVKEHTTVQLAALKVVDHINDLLADFKNICAKLQLVRVTRAFRMRLEYSMDDELARQQMKSEKEILSTLGSAFQIELKTAPGDGLFFASVVMKGDGAVELLSVNRNSAYGSNGRCLPRKELRPFCHCVTMERVVTDSYSQDSV